MWKLDLTLIRNRIGLLIGQFIVLIICFGYIENFYLANILPDKYAKESFQQTDCFLISKKLTVHGHLVRRYRADFLVSYNVNGVQYNRWVSGNGLDPSFARQAIPQQDILSRFAVGKTYPCWYDPKNPELSLLIFRHDWISTFNLIAPAILTVIMLYYFLRTSFNLIKATSKKRRKKEKMKNKIHTDNAPQTIGPYSQAIKVGNTVYFSGQIPLNPNTMTLISDDFTQQTEQVFSNLEAVSEAAGGNLDSIVKLTIYLTDLAHFPIVNSIMMKFFQAPYPARTTIQVSALPKAAQIEIEAVMVLHS